MNLVKKILIGISIVSICNKLTYGSDSKKTAFDSLATSIKLIEDEYFNVLNNDIVSAMKDTFFKIEKPSGLDFLSDEDMRSIFLRYFWLNMYPNVNHPLEKEKQKIFFQFLTKSDIEKIANIAAKEYIKSLNDSSGVLAPALMQESVQKTEPVFSVESNAASSAQGSAEQSDSGLIQTGTGQGSSVLSETTSTSGVESGNSASQSYNPFDLYLDTLDYLTSVNVDTTNPFDMFSEENSSKVSEVMPKTTPEVVAERVAPVSETRSENTESDAASSAQGSAVLSEAVPTSGGGSGNSVLNKYMPENNLSISQRKASLYANGGRLFQVVKPNPNKPLNQESFSAVSDVKTNQLEGAALPRPKAPLSRRLPSIRGSNSQIAASIKVELEPAIRIDCNNVVEVEKKLFDRKYLVSGNDPLSYDNLLNQNIKVKKNKLLQCVADEIDL